MASVSCFLGDKCFSAFSVASISDRELGCAAQSPLFLQSQCLHHRYFPWPRWMMSHLTLAVGMRGLGLIVGSGWNIQVLARSNRRQCVALAVLAHSHRTKCFVSSSDALHFLRRSQMSVLARSRRSRRCALRRFLRRFQCVRRRKLQ